MSIEMVEEIKRWTALNLHVYLDSRLRSTLGTQLLLLR